MEFLCISSFIILHPKNNKINQITFDICSYLLVTKKKKTNVYRNKILKANEFMTWKDKNKN